MAHGRNKYQSRESRARVREILMREWDPIGVSGVPEAADEYDRYVGTVYVMLMDHRATRSHRLTSWDSRVMGYLAYLLAERVHEPQRSVDCGV
jgi:hypothetical protein